MRPYINKVYKAEFDGVCSGEFIILNCIDNFSPDLLKYILHSTGFVDFANIITT
jgi:type I restriction enzyme, S subunit